MADEAALKKQLETCEDFTERREIRKKLRELRERKNNQLEAEVESHPHRTRREKRVEETTITSSDGGTVTETHTTKTEIIENGDAVKEEEVVEVISKDEPDDPDGGGQEPDDGQGAAEAEAELEAELEEELEEELKEELKEELEEKAAEEEPAPEEEEEENVPPYAQKNPQDLTERDIEEIDDLDFLEATLNDLPLKYFDVRKFLRARIRKVKVNQAKQRAESKQKGAAPKPSQSKRVEGPQIDIQDKSQLSQLRQQLEQQKKDKEGGGPSIKTTTTKTTEVRHDGAGGTTTVTKTTKTREVSGGIGGKGGLKSFEAEMARKKKERQAAKAQAFKSAKDKRNAFKDQLEASSPKPAGGVKKSFGAPNTAVNALLEWCRRKTRGYENVDIQNYTTSWADGLAMCALFHNFSPNLVPWETLNPKERKRNWTIAFDAAYAEGMDPLLELEDVLSCAVPEPRSLITYIHSIYQHFHDKAEKAKQEREQNA